MKNLILIFFIFICACAPKQAEKVILNLDESLLKLSLVDLEGKEIKIEDYLQKPLLINYWATWCKPCKMEFPYFNKFIESNGDKINVLMISDEDISKQVRFKNTNRYNFTYLKSKKKLRAYHIRLIPTTTYYNAKGEHLESIQGSVDLTILEDMVSYHNK